MHDAQSAILGGSPLFQHGLPPSLDRVQAPQFMQRTCNDNVSSEVFSFQGDVFTDGAMRGPAAPHLKRAGWSVVSVDNNGLITFGLYGTCPDDFPSAFRAELLAVERALAYACPPITIHVDNQQVINGIQRGEIWCCASARPAADIWRRVWWRLNDIDSENVHFVKVKGHATEADIDAGRTTRKYMVGNSHADHFAGYGVTIAEECAPVWVARNAYDYAKRWYKWLLTLVSCWPDDMQRPTKSDVRSETVDVVPTAAAVTAPPCAHSQRNSAKNEVARSEGMSTLSWFSMVFSCSALSVPPILAKLSVA